MILAAHQPAYLPWLGYFDRIARADVFVYLDDVQFEKNSFTNRNRIKTANGPQWLTVPVKSKGHIGSTMRELAIDDTQDWRRKHLLTIAHSYGRASFYDHAYPRLEKLMAEPAATLADLCWAQLGFWLAEFGIATRMVRQSLDPVDGTKSQLVLNLCKHHGATVYLSGELGRDYLDIESFTRAGIEVRFQRYEPQPYRQLWGAFEPRLAVVDYWMNCGAAPPPGVGGGDHGVQ